MTSIWVNSVLYHVECSDSGRLVTSCSSIGKKFEIISKGNDCPSNRIRFCLCNMGENCFLLVGGSNNSLKTTEIWKFSVINKKWTQLKCNMNPLKSSNGHKVVGTMINDKFVMYLFGGMRGFDLGSELIIFTIQKDEFSYIIKECPKKRAFSRAGHSMTLFDNRIYIFGGVSSGKSLLSDLVEVDFSIFPHNPVWRVLSEEGPKRRYDHTAWIQNGQYYIAGGIDEMGDTLNDIWVFNGEWKAVSVFKSNKTVFGVDIGLIEISNTTMLLEQRPIYEILDSAFDVLHKRLTERTYEFSIPPTPSNIDATPLIIQNCEEISKRAIEAISLLKNAETSQNPHPVPPMYLSVNDALSLKFDKQSVDNQTKINELQSELSNYKSYLERFSLKSQFIDPGDFSTFVEYSKGFSIEKKYESLRRYYSWQTRLRELIEVMDAESSKKLRELNNMQKSYQTKIEQLSLPLSQLISENERMSSELTKYKLRVDAAKRDKVFTEKYHWALKNFKSESKAVTSSIDEEENKYQNVLKQLSAKMEQIKVFSPAIDNMLLISKELEGKLSSSKDEIENARIINETRAHLERLASKFLNTNFL